MRGRSQPCRSKRRNATSAASAFTATIENEVRRLSAGGATLKRRTSERPYDIEELLPVAWLLHIRDLTAAAVRDSRFGNLRVANRIGVGNVFRPDHAGNG